MITKKIRVPIYNAYILLIISKNLVRDMAKYTDDVSSGDRALTIHFNSPLKYVVGFERQTICHQYISHEACHVTHRIMMDTGIDHTLIADEAEAYLIGYIVNKIYKIVKKRKLMCYENKND